MAKFLRLFSVGLFSMVLYVCTEGNLTHWTPCSKTDDLSELIDSRTHQCCHGNVELKQSGKECCYESGEFYFEEDRICCNGTLTDRIKNKPVTCCNNEIIDDAHYLCCDQVKRKLPIGLDRNDASCCGTIPYNITEKFCCNNNENSLHVKTKDVRCCGDRVIDEATHWCANGRTQSKYMAPCGGKQIDLLKQSCCENKANDRPYFLGFNTRNPNSGCCYDKPMNIIAEKCCPRGQVIPKDLDCCGKGSFNKSKELCCNGSPVPRLEGLNACCGPNPYNYKVEGCCGTNEIYNKTTKKCCIGYDGKIHDKGVNCCGSDAMLSDSLCCRGITPIKKDSPDDDKCCVLDNGKRITYNSKEKGCISKGLYTKGKDEHCGSELIEIEEFMCCFGVKYVREQGKQCCGIGTYLPQTQSCCSERIFDIPSLNSTTCRPHFPLRLSTKYDKGSDLLVFHWPACDDVETQPQCCEGNAYLKHNLPRRCVLKMDREKEKSSANLMKEVRSGFGICKGVRFDIHENVCCQGDLYMRPIGVDKSPEELCKSFTVGLPVDKASLKTGSLYVIGLVLLIAAMV